MNDTSQALSRILNPRSIAVVGASNSFANPATNLMASIISGGYQGKIYPIHPREKTALGLAAYPALTDVPGEIDLAVIVVQSRLVPGILEQCGAKGIGQAVVITAGYREMGTEGAALEKELLAAARANGVRFIGPNCIGVINSHAKLDVSMFLYEGTAGAMALVSQSGSYITQPLPYFKRLGMNLSSAVSAGNQADIDIADCIAYFGEDPTTRSVAVYIEGIADGPKFIEKVKKTTVKKPVVALYVGGTEAGSRAGRSHTGAIATPDAIIDGVFAQSGVIRVDTVQSLYDTAHAFATQPLPRGNRVAVITNSGGPGTSMADAAARRGLLVPEFSEALRKQLREIVIPTAQVNNPIDLTMDFDLKRFFVDVPQIIINSGEIDAVLFYGVFGGTHGKRKFESLVDGPDLAALEGYDSYMSQMAEKFVEILAKAGIPVLSSSFTGIEDVPVARMMELGVPVYPTPERAATALAAMARYARWQKGGIS
ncbi:MAG: CoA-binding protein [Deltaproteobacteria bacterium]|nr:CoA-binding protein [Candidatus Zymogenaceae bacterium]